MSPDPSSLVPLFRPRSVAVIGASSNPHKIGGRTFRYIKDNGFPGPVYPINARYEEVQGVPTVPAISELPEPVDLAFVIVPAPGVLAAVEACAERGVRSVVVFSSGFAEVDEPGARAQARLGEVARESGMRIVGPNCMGVMNVGLGLFGTFTGSFDFALPEPGRIGVVSQSGAFGSHGYMLLRERGMAMSLWATTGNECDVDVSDCLAYVAEDDETDVIIAYMEGCRDRERLVRALTIAEERHKPIVMLKVGRSDVGAAAASSHTASLVGADAVYDALFREYGVHRARSIEELMDVAYACTAGTLPTTRRTGLVTLSGGVGVVMADAATEAGLEVPAMPDAAQRRLKELLPFAAVRNPVDVTAQALNDWSIFIDFLEVMLDEGGCDSIAIFLAAVGLNSVVMEPLMEPLESLRRRHPDKLMLLSTMVEGERRRALEAMGYLIFEDPTRGLNAVAALTGFSSHFARGRSAGPMASLPDGAEPTPREALGEHAAKRHLATAGIPVVEERLVGSAAEARAAAAELGYPVVMKIASRDIPHKSEIGGVVVGPATPQEVADGYATLVRRARDAAPDARLDGVLVARLVAGVETILGVQRDPVFGPVVLFGLGGIFVEVFEDVTLRIAPFGVAAAREMIREVKGFPLLDGARGGARADVEALAETLSRLSVYAAENRDRLETLDLNPVLVRPEGEGVVAVDALIVPGRDRDADRGTGSG